MLLATIQLIILSDISVAVHESPNKAKAIGMVDIITDKSQN